MTDPLRHFGPATTTWFRETFQAPTPAQIATWDVLAPTAHPRHALVIAPTGSGKTLAAFLMSLDRLSGEHQTGKVKVLYISPLKALAVDIEANLARPLNGIAQIASQMGLPAPAVTVAVRSGDTTPAQRRRMITHPPDILITTPESLFLMLSSSAAETLDSVETVIVDEIHSLAGTKRGAHLALSLERLDAHHEGSKPIQRIGLSATVRPPSLVAEFLAGPGRQVDIIDPPMPKQWALDVSVPVDDMTNLGAPPGPSPSDEAPNASIWPHVEQAVLDLVLAHRSTICFVNSRMVAERLTAHLNQYAAAREGTQIEALGAMPTNYIGTHMVAVPQDTVVARAHHGSLSKERRATIEDDLRQGRLRCVVATSSLELGIDMGFVDLVIQIGSPPSVASGLQRVGRAGHKVGVVSKGVVMPTSRTDLVECAVVVKRMADGLIEPVPVLHNPLDVLAQQIVSMCLDAAPTSADVYALVRRSQPFASLPRAAFDSVLEMLAGRYPSEDFAELRPRLTWDHLTDKLMARPGSRQLVTTSGGTIPDRGLYGVFVTNDSGAHRGSRRVGELDEEMVHESRIGDIITLGTSSWRIESITPHQVNVTPAPGAPGRLPFWKGDSIGRPFELGVAIGQFIADPQLSGTGLDERASANLLRYITEQKRATGVLPSDTTIVLERFRDELGDWRVCLHAPFGLGVLRPWMLAVQQTLMARYGVDARVIVHNDGVIWRLPGGDADPPGAAMLAIRPDELEPAVTQALFSSSLFAAHFRECAARSLLLPRRNPGVRTPLWQQRLKASQLLEVAAGYQGFPIVMEAMRECLDNVFDMPALLSLLTDIEAGRVALVEVTTPEPSPFARSLQFGYVGEFIYDADQPLAERASAAMAIDQHLLAGLLGATAAQDSLDQEAVADVEAGLARLRHPATSAEAFWDALRRIGPLTIAECALRCPAEWLDDLAAAGRVVAVTIGGRPGFAVTGDDALIDDAAGGDVAARQRLVTRWLRSHVIVTPDEIDDRYGWEMGVAQPLLETLGARRGRFDDARPAIQYAWPDNLAAVARRRAATLRAATKPVDSAHMASFLADWHGLQHLDTGSDALLRAVEQLAGWPVPSSMLETLVLPARVADYNPSLLDQALVEGQVIWTGAGRIGDRDGWVTLWPADLVLTQPPDDIMAWLGDDNAGTSVWQRLEQGGAWRVSDFGLDTSTAQAALWRLAWGGLATCDTFAPVRDMGSMPGSAQAFRAPRTPLPRRVGLRQVRPYLPALAGRWSAVRPTASDEATRSAQAVALILTRHGVLTRGAAMSEAVAPSYSAVYQVLGAMETQGLVRRGYFVDNAGASQFALPGAVDRLRATPADDTLVLAACDPANPYGTTLDWPATRGHRPARRAGAIVVLKAGLPICFLERGARTLTTFEGVDDHNLALALDAIGAGVDAYRFSPVTITQIDQQGVLADAKRVPLLREAGFKPTPQGFIRRPSDRPSP